MDFKDISIEDKPLLQRYLPQNPYGNCDYSFGNLFIWQGTYKSKYCIHKDNLIIRSVSLKGEPMFLMPLGPGDKKEILRDMINFSEKEGFRFKLAAVTPMVSDELESIMPGRFEIQNPNELCDYVYLSENLRLLAGKKLSSKRNHINKFMAKYASAYRYAEITESVLPMCADMNDAWRTERGGSKTDGDFCAVTKALTNWDKLGLVGGAILVDGEMAAFSFGQPNNAQTFNVMAEKALTRFDGAYAVINRDFAVKNCGDYPLVNREEDMGVEGLKKAKLSYCPHLLLTKAEGTLV